MFESIKRIFGLGWKMFLREKGITVATVFVLFLVINLIGGLFLLKDMGTFLIQNVEDKVDISVYFKQSASEDEILTIKKKIVDFPEVKRAEYISQDKALNQFTERHKSDFSLIESIEELGMNPFLASLNVQAKNPSQYEKVYAFLSNLETGDIIEKIDYYQRETVIQKIHALSSQLSQAGLYLAIILFIVAVIVTLNTVRLSIYNSKKEIEIQKLVGASNWFIKAPFLIQGMLCGVTASIISFLCLAFACWFFNPQIRNLFLDFNLYNLFMSEVWTLLGIQVMVGILLGVISSNIAVKKYLKV